jgi:monofunctional biosynthetic peptidoglycan transglycosylase
LISFDFGLKKDYIGAGDFNMIIWPGQDGREVRSEQNKQSNRLASRCRGFTSRLWKVVAVIVVITIFPTLCLRWVPPGTSSFMLQRRMQAFLHNDHSFRLRYKWIGWRNISKWVPVAVVAAEDQKFPEHLGFDTEAIAQALNEDRNQTRGASTITQQVAKNLFLWPGRSFIRKGLEAYFTLLIEFLWPKRRILEVYLNIAEFGVGVFGISAASDTFFGMQPSQLGPEEAALLAAVLPNPHRLRVQDPSAYVIERSLWIQEQVRMLGGLSYLKTL